MTGFGFLTLIFIGICIALVYISRKELYRKQFIYSFESLTIDILFNTFVSGLAIFIGTRLYSKIHIEKRHHNFIIMPFEKSLLNVLFFALILFAILFLILKYFEGKKQKIGSLIDIPLISAIIERTDSATTAGLALLKDKEIYYYYQDLKKVAINLKC